MNFFEHQERARRNTRKLVLLFALAVACIIAALYFVGLGAVTWMEVSRAVKSARPRQPLPWGWWRPEVLACVSVAALAIIGGGSLYKISTLGRGGTVVAESVGGRLVDLETADPDERKLLNVVEEMAIASGVPMPMVFALDKEEGINAFAAGFTPNDAAVAVTTGALRLLKRDELQGVIAHEFSHILCGDMRLNIRLIGLTYGILIIAIIGRGMIQAAGRGTGRRGRGAVGGILIGAALTAIGYIGVLFGRLIKAAISRQREFFADASAVDLTRNPDGIAGALKKIGGYGFASRVLAAEGESVSHMLFGDWRLKAFQTFGLLSTHPPLSERIQRLDPAFDGKFPSVEPLPTDRVRYCVEDTAIAGAPAMLTRAKVTAAPADVIGLVGRPQAAHLAYGASLLASIPGEFRAAALQPARAVCMVYAFLLDADAGKQERQTAILKGELKPILVDEVLRLSEISRAMNPVLRLPLLDLALPALRRLNENQRRAFLKHVQLLAGADQETTLSEFALQCLLTRRMEAMEKPSVRQAVYAAYTPLRLPCATVLSVLARIGQRDEDSAVSAFRTGASRLPSGEEALQTPLPPEACSFAALGEALDKLVLATPIIKQRVLDAFAHCVLADGTVTIEEAELLRAIAVYLDCPIPPFLPAGEAAGSPNVEDA
jgi:Zn-dependent protease with chaperone function